VTDWPGSSEPGPPPRVTRKSAQGETTFTVSGAVPVFETSKLALLKVPMPTGPNSSELFDKLWTCASRTETRLVQCPHRAK